MEYLQIFFEQYGELLLQGTWDTIVMTLVSTVFAYIIGIPLGVAVVLTDPKKGLLPHRAINAVLGWIINIGRSIPFIILLVAIIPFTRLVVGTSLGVPGAIVLLLLWDAWWNKVSLKWMQALLKQPKALVLRFGRSLSRFI